MEAESCEISIDSIDSVREEGELSDDGEIIDLTDDVVILDEVVVEVPSTETEGDSTPGNKTKDSPKTAPRKNKLKRKSPGRESSRYKHSSREKKPLNLARKRSRSRSRDRFGRDLGRSREYTRITHSRVSSRTDTCKLWDKYQRNKSSIVSNRNKSDTDTGSAGSRIRGQNVGHEKNGNNRQESENEENYGNRSNSQKLNEGVKAGGRSGAISLMDLMVQPLPSSAAQHLPSAPPPPLSSAPPPDQALPPPLLQTIPGLRGNKRQKKPQRKPRIVPPRSPPGEVDNDYIDLLLEYKQIQKQLENIKKEEQRAASVRKTKDEGSRLSKDSIFSQGVSRDVEGRSRGTESPTNRDIPNYTPTEIPPWRTKRQEPTDIIQVNSDDEEGDLNELQLRLAALASAAKANPRATEKRSERPWRQSSVSKKRGRPLTHRDSVGSSSNVSKRRHIDDEPPWIRRDRARREEIRRVEDERRRGEDERRREEEEERRKEEQRRREVQKILTLDNPDEQVERFIRLCNLSREEDNYINRYRYDRSSPHARYNAYDSPYSPSNDDYLDQGKLLDDYEVKEMELDSDISSPEIEVERDREMFGNEREMMGLDDKYHHPGYMTFLPSGPDMYQTGPDMYHPVPHLPPLPPRLNNVIDGGDYFHPMEMTYLLPPPPPPPPDEIPPPPPPLSAAPSPPPPPPPPELPPPIDDTSVHPDPSEIPEEGAREGPEERKEGMEEKEDEAAELRAVLLQSMKRRTVLAPEEGKSSGSSSPITVLSRNNLKSKKKRPHLPIPRHEPVVISLGAESGSEDSDNEGETECGKPTNPHLLSSLDQFLKDARQSVEKKELSKTSPTTPEALKNLPKEKIDEYKKLKEEIKRRERNKLSAPQAGRITKSASQPPLTTISQDHSDQGPVISQDNSQEVTVTSQDQVEPISVKSTKTLRVERMAKTGMKIQIGEGPRLVKPGQNVGKKSPPSTGDGTTDASSENEKSTEKENEEQKESDEKDIQTTEDDESEEKISTEEGVRELEARLAGQRVQLEEDESVFMTLKEQIVKRKQTLKTAEAKAQKLREQLAASERIVKAHRQQIHKYIIQARGIKGSVDERRLVVQQLETEALQAGKRVMGDNYSLQLQSINKLPSPEGLRRIRQLTSTVPRDATMNQLAREKYRLLQLEKLYAEKIRKLKGDQKDEGGAEGDGRPRVPPTTPHKIVTSEKMDLTKITDSDVAEEIVTVTPIRRRSLVEIQKNGPLRFIPVDAELMETSEVIKNSESRKAGSVKGEESSKENTEARVTGSVDARNSDRKPSDKSPSDKSPSDKSPSDKSPSDITPSRIAPSQGIHGSIAPPVMAKLAKMQSDKLVKFHTSGCVITSTCDANILPSWWPAATQVPNKKLDLKIGQKEEDGDRMEQNESLKTYKSPLLCFRSYRFNPYLRTKEKLRQTSRSFTHKINPWKEVCKFDIHGTCNDEKCPWQHEKDYTLSKKEMLQDIASYYPELSGATTNTPKKNIPQLIDTFVEGFRKQNEKMTHDEQCLLLASRVSEAAKRGHPHHIIPDRRVWFPTQNDTKKRDASRVVVKKQTQLPPRDVTVDQPGDNTILQSDIRYWMLTSAEVDDMETAVLDSPHNTHLWIKLAYKKLNDEKNESTGIDKSLNVFAHALQANRTDSELWLHYLTIYARRTDATDLTQLCEQALKYAPNYSLFWKYLGFVKSFSAKQAICERAQQWLCELSTDPHDTKSHQLLEITLQLVNLCVSTGRFKSGLQILRTLVHRGEGESLHKHLKPVDRCVAALSYIHLLEFKCLPANLYDPRQGLHAPIVSKELAEFGWSEGKGPRIAVATLEQLFRDSERTSLMCVNLSEEEGDLISSLMYSNWLRMYSSAKKYDAGISLCRRVQIKRPHDMMIITHLARFYAQSGDMEQAQTTLHKGIEDFPHNIEIFYCMATLDVSQGSTDSAIEHLENAVIDYYEVEKANYDQCDPNLLYCHLLEQPVPLAFVAPPLKEAITEDTLHKNKKYLWLSYCLLLKLQGDLPHVSEAYESAISSLHQTKDVQAIWFSYLQHELQVVNGCSLVTQASATSRWYDLVRRCLISMPSSYPVPYRPTHTWLNYRFHNDVVELVVKHAPRDQVMNVYDSFINMMPANVQLISRACEDALRLGDRALARGITTMGLLDHPGSLQLWKVHLRLAQWNSTYWEVKKTFEKALKIHPLILHIWKDYLLYELVHGSTTTVDAVLTRCEDYQVIISDYLSTITETNKNIPGLTKTAPNKTAPNTTSNKTTSTSTTTGTFSKTTGTFSKTTTTSNKTTTKTTTSISNKTTSDKTGGTSNKPTGISSKATGISSMATNISSKATGISNKATGTSNKTGGTSNKPTGISSKATGISSKATGISSKATGISSKPTGISSKATGISNKTTTK